MTLKALKKELGKMDQNAPLIFTTDGKDIGAGYHVTELKAAQIKSIDCAANLRHWQGASLQLLDGAGGTHMSVQSFQRILSQSLKALPELGDALLRVEFTPKNEGLQLLEWGGIAAKEGSVYVELNASRAQCKPMIEPLAAVSAQTSSGCCGSAKSACC